MYLYEQNKRKLILLLPTHNLYIYYIQIDKKHKFHKIKSFVRIILKLQSQV